MISLFFIGRWWNLEPEAYKLNEWRWENKELSLSFLIAVINLYSQIITNVKKKIIKEIINEIDID
jgi:hypothetical protein